MPASPGAAAAPESGAREQKESRENQQVGADVLQCQLSSSHGQTLKGIHRAKNLYYPKEKCICSGMQRILSLLSSSVGSPEVSLLSGCAVRMKRLHSPIPCGATVAHLTLAIDNREGLYTSEEKSEFKS